jgi:hypothetical protein
MRRRPNRIRRRAGRRCGRRCWRAIRRGREFFWRKRAAGPGVTSTWQVRSGSFRHFTRTSRPCPRSWSSRKRPMALPFPLCRAGKVLSLRFTRTAKVAETQRFDFLPRSFGKRLPCCVRRAGHGVIGSAPRRARLARRLPPRTPLHAGDQETISRLFDSLHAEFPVESGAGR